MLLPARPQETRTEGPSNDLIELINYDKTSNQRVDFLKVLVRS